MNRYSYAIIIPKIWLNHHGLKRRDKIEFEILDEQQNRALLLRPVKAQANSG